MGSRATESESAAERETLGLQLCGTGSSGSADAPPSSKGVGRCERDAASLLDAHPLCTASSHNPQPVVTTLGVTSLRRGILLGRSI